MNNESTDTYTIIKREFKDTIAHYNLANNRELAAFLHYNTHNEMFIGTDEEYYRNVNFRNLDTDRESRFFTEGYIYFFPKGNDLIKPGNNMTAFSINKSIKCIRINSNGLFIEKSDLKGNIITEYYDNAALEEIEKLTYSAGSIDYIEENIQRHGIKPDRIINVDNKEDGIVFSVIENNEVIQQQKLPKDASRTIYSIYFEIMKQNDYYDDNMLQVNKSGAKK